MHRRGGWDAAGCRVGRAWAGGAGALITASPQAFSAFGLLSEAASPGPPCSSLMDAHSQPQEQWTLWVLTGWNDLPPDLS